MRKHIKVVIASHRTLPNPIVDNLKEYLFTNYKGEVLDITHPLLETDESFENSSKSEWFHNRKPHKQINAFHWKMSVPLLYVKDFVYTLIWSLRFGRCDLYFGVGNLNPVAGIILKKLGRINKVVYYCQDYFQDRFKDPVLNNFYFQLDKFCVRYSDETWNVSAAMVEARERKMGMRREVYNRQFTVPGGIWFRKVKRVPFPKVDRQKIVYRGTLLDWQGVDLAIKAMPFIIKKIRGARLEIIGGGPEEIKLKNLAKKLKVEKSVLFHGLITDRQKMEEMLRNASLGVATFNTRILDDKVKNGDPGKIKDYMVMGMPVITTDALYYHQRIIDKKCGIVVDYNPKQFADSVIKLLSDKSLLKIYRQNALKFIKDFDWNKIYSKNIGRVLT